MADHKTLFPRPAGWLVWFLAWLSMMPAIVRAHQADECREIVLPSGLRVLLVPVDGVQSVAVQAIHPVGFLDDPEGLPQGAHLLEHLMCQGATSSHLPGASMVLLSRDGLANAETLADWTHYDFVVPPDRLEVALSVHAERLASLRIDQAIIAQEGGPAGLELRAVERSPVAPVFKFAIMAAHQAWRYGKEDVRLVHGLADTPAATLAGLWRARYRPADALIVITGAFNPDHAEALVRKTLGSIPAAPDAPRNRPPLDWQAMPLLRTLTWDGAVAAAIVAWAPPTDLHEAAALSLWCEALLGRLAADPALAEVSRSTFGTNSMWPATPSGLPVFFCISVREGVDPNRAADVLKGRVIALAASPPPGGAAAMSAQLRQGATALAQRPADVIHALRRQLKAGGVGPLGMNLEHLMLGNGALQIGWRAMVTGPKPQKWLDGVVAAALKVEDLRAAVLTEAGARVTVITPK